MAHSKVTKKIIVVNSTKSTLRIFPHTKQSAYVYAEPATFPKKTMRNPSGKQVKQVGSLCYLRRLTK